MAESIRAIAAQPWLAELLAGSNEGIALFGPDGRIVRHNDRLAALTEKLPGHLSGLPVLDLFDDPTFRLALAAAVGRGHWSGRLRVGTRIVDTRVRVSRDGYGVLCCQDTSERDELDRRARALAATLEEHTTRAASARELLFEQSERLTTVYQITLDALESATVNDTAERICAALADDLPVTDVALWILDPGPAVLRRVAARGERAAALPAVCPVDAAPNAAEALATGRAVPVSREGALAGFAAFPLTGPHRPLGVVTLNAAPDLDELQLFAVHSGAAVHNAILADELARANQELRAADEQKTNFLNDIAHDLRTPLTCIRTYADLLQMYADAPPETYTEFLGVIAEETERLGELLDKFLDLARLENATMKYTPEPIRVEELATHFGDVYRGRAAAEGIALRIDAAEDLPVIMADRRRIEQVFSNLLSNAFKFTPAGGRVAVAVRADGRGVRVTVSDSGPGVPEEERQRIFERFRQSRSGGGQAGGTGLGLAIAQGVVNAHGGRIWVEDADLGGAAFAFWLPLEPPADAPVRRSMA
ncbi:MAG: PAS domain-containing sensor histidine kinase [Armatimonadetes bacterium]|nr:PAS domain-containing sensor histidine kinase [Armatimonadota bacterium]